MYDIFFLFLRCNNLKSTTKRNMNRTILFFTVLGAYCVGAGSAVAQKKLPYKEVLEATVSSGGNIEVSPSFFYPDADFSIDFSAKLGQGSDGKVAVLASNSHAFGANLTISSNVALLSS